MKRIFFFSLLLTMVCFSQAFGYQIKETFSNPTYSPETISNSEEMLLNIKTHFPRLVLDDNFDFINDTAQTEIDGYTHNITFANGIMSYSLIDNNPNNSSLSKDDTSFGFDYFDITGSYENFYAKADIKIINEDETKNGYCFFEFTNYAIVGQEKRSTIVVDFPYEISKYQNRLSKSEQTKIYDLTPRGKDDKWHQIEFVRINGNTSVFIDHNLIAKFDDGLSGKYFIMLGAGFYPGGTAVTCGFDNIVVRKQ